MNNKVEDDIDKWLSVMNWGWTEREMEILQLVEKRRGFGGQLKCKPRRKTETLSIAGLPPDWDINDGRKWLEGTGLLNYVKSTTWKLCQGFVYVSVVNDVEVIQKFLELSKTPVRGRNFVVYVLENGGEEWKGDVEIDNKSFQLREASMVYMMWYRMKSDMFRLKLKALTDVDFCRFIFSVFKQECGLDLFRAVRDEICSYRHFKYESKIMGVLADASHCNPFTKEILDFFCDDQQLGDAFCVYVRDVDPNDEAQRNFAVVVFEALISKGLLSSSLKAASLATKIPDLFLMIKEELTSEGFTSDVIGNAPYCRWLIEEAELLEDPQQKDYKCSYISCAILLDEGVRWEDVNAKIEHPLILLSILKQNPQFPVTWDLCMKIKSDHLLLARILHDYNIVVEQGFIVTREEKRLASALYSFGLIEQFEGKIDPSWVIWTPRTHKYCCEEKKKLVYVTLMIMRRSVSTVFPKDLKVMILTKVLANKWYEDIYERMPNIPPDEIYKLL